MLNQDVKTIDHKVLIIRILEQHKLSENNLKIVASTHKWAKERRITSIDREILAFNTIENNNKTGSKKILIVFKKEMPIEDVKSAILRIDFPSTVRSKFLDTPEKFIEHLTLHEIGHSVYGMSQKDENKADNFAFEQMGVGDSREH